MMTSVCPVGVGVSPVVLMFFSPYAAFVVGMEAFVVGMEAFVVETEAFLVALRLGS